MPALSYTYSGLVNGDTASVLSGALATTGTAAAEFAAIRSAGDAGSGQQLGISFTDGTLTVTPATLTVDATARPRSTGQQCRR